MIGALQVFRRASLKGWHLIQDMNDKKVPTCENLKGTTLQAKGTASAKVLR